jgi:hypothetical protein
MGQNMSQIREDIEKMRKIEAKRKALKNVNVSGDQEQNMDALDKELNQLLNSYRFTTTASTTPTNVGSNAKVRRNFYVADFTDGAYYTTDHIGEKGAYKDGPKRAMNIMINDGGYYYDKTSCSQACKDYKYFGLQDGSNNRSQCFCSDSWTSTTQYGTDTCGEQGGPWCNYVYENVKPPPIPTTMHLGKLYYAEKGVKDKQFTIYEYPTKQIDFTGQDGVTKVKFFKIANYDSPYHDKVQKILPNLAAAKQYCLEVKAVGFAHHRNTNKYWFKTSIFPQTKKVPNDNVDFYIVVPAIKNAEPCNKHVEIISPTFIGHNCVIKSGIPPSNVCDGLNTNTDVGLGSINERLMSLGATLATNMKKNIANAQKYNNNQPVQREKYQKTLNQYEKIINVINNRKIDIDTEDAISADAKKNVHMRKIFIYLCLVIIGTIVIFYLFGFSKIMVAIILTIYYIALYILVTMKDS